MHAMPLDPGYVCEFDRVDADSWHDLMRRFEDASFYQTWAFGAVHSGESCLGHAVLTKHGSVVAMAQVRVFGVLGLPIGIAYVNNGPMWTRTGTPRDADHLRNMLRALHHEYVVNRGYLLRIVPTLIDSAENAPLTRAFIEAGFEHRQCPGETVVVDLSPPLEELRRQLGRKWRQTLRSGEKKELVILEGADQTLCDLASRVFREMKGRKRFFGGDQRTAIEVHGRLPDSLKLHFTVCMHAGEPVAALGYVTFGSTGLPLVSATGKKALDLDAAYVLWWRMIEYYKTHGFSMLDTGGVSRERNPGGYYFKTHILGKKFKEPSRRLGEFDACRNPLSKGLCWALCATRDGYRALGRRVARTASACVGADQTIST